MRKVLALAALLLLMPTLVAAEQIDSWTANDQSQDSGATSTTYVEYLTATLPSGESGTYLIFGHFTLSIDSLSAEPTVRICFGNATLSTCSGATATLLSVTGPWIFNTSSDSGWTYNFLWQCDTECNGSGNKEVRIEYNNTSAVGTVYGENAAIVIMDKPTNAVYAESCSILCQTATSSDPYDAVATANVTASTWYYVIAAGEFAYEDEDNNGTWGPIFTYYDGTDRNQLGGKYINKLIGSFNDSVFWSMGLAGRYQSDSSSTRQFTITIKGNGSSDQAYARRVAIVAIPYSDFEENGCDDEQTAQTNHQGDSWTDSDTSCAVTPKDADYLVSGGGNVSNESTSYVGQFRLNENDTNYFENRSSNDQSQPAYTNFMAFAPTWTSGASRTVKMQGNTAQTAANQEAEFGINGFVNVFRLDTTTTTAGTTTAAGYRYIFIGDRNQELDILTAHLDEDGLPRPECMKGGVGCLDGARFGMVSVMEEMIQ